MNQEERKAEFSSADTLTKAIMLVRGFGAYHTQYSFYTDLGRIDNMLRENGPRMWLTRIDSGKFDDGIEASKYGTAVERKRTYIKSFMFGNQESAAMWGLYSQPTYKAIRVTVSRAAIESLLKAKIYKIRNGKSSNVVCGGKAVLSDLVYASVEDEDHPKQRSKTLYWNGVYSKQISNLAKSKDWKSATGFVKDVEWRFENEFRLVVKTVKDLGDHIAIELPYEFIKSMSFTISPWANDDEKMFVRGRLSAWLSRVGRKIASDDDNVIADSVLAKGLQHWARQRGL